MSESIMHFDAHVAFQVPENSHNIADKFCVVPGLVVTIKFLHNQNNSLPCFQVHFVHCFQTLDVLGQTNMPAFKFTIVISEKGLSQASEAATTLF